MKLFTTTCIILPMTSLLIVVNHCTLLIHYYETQISKILVHYYDIIANRC